MWRGEHDVAGEPDRAPGGASRMSDESSTALHTAFQENAAAIYRFVYAKVGNRETAQDLTSVVFLKAVRWLAADRSGDSIRSWLYATARTTVADYWRERALDARLVDEISDGLLFCGTDPVEETRRTRGRARRILASLPEREREVLRLRLLHGFDARQIGSALGVTPGHARVLQLRALRRAANSLQTTADAPDRPGAGEEDVRDD
jgi:RNA polymerase sigma-70 factor (ECF subfamily)